MRTPFLCIAAISLLLGACDTAVNDNDFYDYSIEQQMGCFCPQGGQWVRLLVRADTIANAINISTGSNLTYEQWRPYRTISGLFDEISLRDTSVYEVRVEIDSTYNYPSFVYFNPKPIVHGDTVLTVMDAQLSYSTRNYVRFSRQ